MRVKRLEIQGFKSFKDKTTIHFDHGITGIVGPNGCGKSNIVDAFFWVMGEQSYKHMRGSGSDDLIFNGSSKYSPLGLAEATMVLETDFDSDAGNGQGAAGPNAPAGASVPVHLRSKEIAVTRRLYRGGEGEYFINGVPARLKDIQELFMDTGVGAKGYSVIEQGQIGKIVNSKPEERRLLIEEAAGIAKYKKRKQESLRKMEATQTNMSRLTDVIQEIERSLNSLERQAQKARQYKKYKDELLDKEMTWGRRKTKVLRQRLEQLRSQKEALEQELVGLKAELQIAENSIETDRVDQVTDTKQAEELQARIQQLSDELTREKSALELSRQRQTDLHKQLETLENEKTEIRASIETESERISAREIEVEEANEQFQVATDKAQSLDEEVRRLRQEAETARRELDARKKELMSGITRASDLNSRAASLSSRIESARAQAERLNQQSQSHHERLTQVREEAQNAQETSESTRIKREELQAEKKELATQVQEQEQNVRALDRARDEASRNLTQVRSKLQSLEELAAAYEGFGDGPKAALEYARDHGGEGKVFALADALEVSDEYETALAGWLENRLENLITQEGELALRALQQLTQDKSGRVSIHVSAAQVTPSGSFDQIRKILESAGFQVAGTLDQSVKVSGNLSAGAREIASRTIANVAIVRSFEPMAALISSGKVSSLGGWSVVSTDGSALNADGTLRGGSAESDGTASLLKRKRAIAELQEQVGTAEIAHQTAEQSATDARQSLELARARLQTLQSDVQALEVQAAALDRDVHQMTRALRDAESAVELVALEIKEMEEEAEKATSDREQVSAQLEEIFGSREELEAQIASGDEEVTARELEVRNQETELQLLKVNEAQLRERSHSLKRELETGRTVIADRQRRLSDIDRILERAMQERQQYTGGESGIEQRIEELTLQLATNRDALAIVKDRLEQSSAQLNVALERIKSLHKSGDAKTSEANSMGIEVEKLASDLSHLIQNLEEKYGPGCLERPAEGTSPIQEEMTEPVVTAEMSAEEEQLLGEEVERLRERIRRLGEVNVGAIEEFEETQKRYDYLANEKKDLEKSIENLQEAIEHINKTSEERFRKAFEAIADRFKRLFPIIFGGGRAELSLVYPEGSTDILDAGVDILAQPPGKKIVNIGLLSGGEKALTAVSLIFAIFMVKPSPFCVLDEVDAPLDDANIGKFNALLREMSAKSQFIVITHNKKTMELNDTLYGVTMEEPGVSKMVSIELQ